jgi:NADP-dependent 3-hydroxy acid dehydrogenase YdfG
LVCLEGALRTPRRTLREKERALLVSAGGGHGAMKQRELKGAVVVLTGASSGIGRAAAFRFAARGARLVLAARDPDALEEVAVECRDTYGAQVAALVTDVRDEGSVEALANVAVERFGGIDVWVNDAAVYMMGNLEDCPAKAIQALLDTNVMGAVHGTRAAMTVFRRQGRGVLINMGSVAGKISYAKAGAYCASKHAVHAITEALRQEIRGTDIHACLVVPATVDTPLFQHAANYTGREMVAMRPVYKADRVARAIVGLAERPRREAVIGAAPVLMTLFDRIVPWLFERVMRALVDVDHLGPAAAVRSSGNLTGPRGPHAIDGGWRARRSPTTKLLAGVRTAALPVLTSGG